MIAKSANPWFRLIAFFLDNFLIGVFALILGFFIPASIEDLQSYGILLGWGISLVYFTIGYSGIMNGQTLGKRIMSIRVTGRNNEPLPAGRALLRALVLTAPFTLTRYPLPFLPDGTDVSGIQSLFFILLLIVYFIFSLMKGANHRSIHDFLSGSFVVVKNSEAEVPVSKPEPVIVAIIGSGFLILFTVLSVLLIHRNPVETSDSLKAFDTLENKMMEMEGVVNCNVSESTTTWRFKGEKTMSRNLVIDLYLDERPQFDGVRTQVLFTSATMIAMEHHDSLETLDRVNVRLNYGLNMGIARRNFSISDSWEVDELMNIRDEANAVSQMQEDNLPKVTPDGRRIQRSRYRDGTLASEIIYLNNKREGISKIYDKYGNLEYEIEYHDGRRNGITTQYYENGRKKAELLYRDDQLIKYLGKWDPEGNELPPEL